MEEQKKQILNENLRKLLFKFSLPSVIGMMVAALYNFTDTIYVGKGVGPDAIAGLTIIFPIIVLIIAVTLMTGVGAASIISRFLGKGNPKRALVAAGNSSILNIILNIVFIVIVYFYMENILQFLGASEAVLPYARDYLSIMLWGFILFSLSIHCNKLIMAEGKPRASMYVMLIGAILNIILDPIFIFILDMGVKGAAIATVLSQFLSILFIIVFFWSKGSIYHFNRESFRLDFKILREIITIGFPSFMLAIIGSIMFMVFIKMVWIYGGDQYLTITGIGIRIMDLIFMPIFGISHGFSPIVGFNFGANSYRRVKEVLKEGLIWATAISLVGFILMVAFPQVLISIFTNDPEIIRNGIIPLRIIAILAPLWAFPILGATFFQAIGKAKPALVISITRDLLVIPAIIIFPKFLDIFGIWLSWPFTDFISIFISGGFLLSEVKKINRMIAREESLA